jgi:hypothetical protein
MYAPLPYAFNIKNSVQLISDLKNIPIDKNSRLASFDISNMYTNVPTAELPSIVESACTDNRVDEAIKLDILKRLRLILNQNYFQFMGKTYIQHEGLAMGAPTSSILSEFYLQYVENSSIYNILLSFKIIGYFRYVDDILLIYNEDNTNIEDVLHQFNNIAPSLNFTIERENECSINFLDLTIHRKYNSLSIDIFRKPTYTDSIIPIDSCHPTEHKYAAIRFLMNRLNNYQLSHTKRNS